MEQIQLPESMKIVLNRLEQYGFEAFVVGGCVRDALLHRPCSDWDVTTNALPEEISEVFSEYPQADVGKQHGTVVVVIAGEPIEITTYRIEGAYQDHRHPSSVSFTSCLEEDLARRDFTINAMAYHPKTGIIDPFFGKRDLQKQQIRAVGQAEQRFQEDALRILRGLRFAAQLTFSIEEDTQTAMRNQQVLLDYLSKERICAEVSKLLCAPNCVSVLRENAEIFFQILPELRPMQGFQQNTPYHCFDVWEHTLHALEATPLDLILRLTMLLHDSGKPHTYVEDEKGVGHFPGHAKVSVQIAEAILSRLHFDKKTTERVCLLVTHHDLVMQQEERWVKRQLNRFGEEVFFQLLTVHRSDAAGQSAICRPRFAEYDRCEAIAREIIAQQQCFQLRDLAVTGRDLITLGIPQGKKIGAILEQLLQNVMDGTCTNEKEPLLALAEQLKETK